MPPLGKFIGEQAPGAARGVRTLFEPIDPPVAEPVVQPGWPNVLLPIPVGAQGRVAGSGIACNTIATAFAREAGMAVNDLSVLARALPPGSQMPGNVPFTRVEDEELAAGVAASVRAARARRERVER